MRREWAAVRTLCWSDATIKARRSQWSLFVTFCESVGLPSLPTTTETMCLYITHLTKRVGYVTITNYVCGVGKMHEFMGYDPPDMSSFLYKSTLLGAKRLLGDQSTPALPLTPSDLVRMRGLLDLSNPGDLRFWCAVLLAFRCVLRVGHVTSSPHELKRKDIVWTADGFDVVISSSKTVQFRERVRIVPVVRAINSVLCPVGPLKTYLRLYGRSSDSSLFGLTYSVFSTKLRAMCTKLGLVGHYSTHSIRRGAATFLATFMPLQDVKLYGDWKSWAVLLYLSDTYSTRRTKDKLVADRLSSLF